MPLLPLNSPMRRQENMDMERESTPKRKGFLTAARAYIAKIIKTRTKTNINARIINLEHQNQSLTRLLTNTSSKQETINTMCSSKDEKEESDVTVKMAEQKAQLDAIHIRMFNECVEMHRAANLRVQRSEEEIRRSAQAKKDAEERAKELKKADELLARVRNRRGYIK
jgi:hypothetical protein